MLTEASTYDYAAKLADQEATFASQMRGLAGEMRTGALTLDQWYYRSQVTIQGHVLDSYRLGLASARGVAPSAVRLTATERKGANQQIVAQYEYMAKFRDAVKARLATGKDLTTLVDSRAAMYAGSMRDTFTAARLSQQPEERLTWNRHASDSCETCIAMNGQTKTAAEWEAGGIWPAHGTRCLSNCKCQLVDSSEVKNKASAVVAQPAETPEQRREREWQERMDAYHRQIIADAGDNVDGAALEVRDAAMMLDFRAWGRTISAEEASAIQGYKSWTYGEITHYLRLGTLPSVMSVEQIEATARGIDTALARGQMERTFTAFRGLDDNFSRRYTDDAFRALKGQTFTDKSFISTSINRDLAQQTFSGKGGILCEIEIEQGAHAGYLPEAKGVTGWIGGKPEWELLLPRNLSLQVIDASIDASGSRVLRLRYSSG